MNALHICNSQIEHYAVNVAQQLKPQDVVVALKLVALGRAEWTQPELARALHLSVSEINHGLKRLAASHLFNPVERRVIRATLQEFLVGGLRYVFPTQLGLFGEGMPTAFSVGPLAMKLRLGDEDGVVWLTVPKLARVRGRVIDPLYPTVPEAAGEDPILHEYLALADTLRVGRARERAMARDELARRLAS
jgi:predicted transcriptional regulator